MHKALHRLAQDGVVVLRPNRGAQVPEPTRAEGAHVFDARRVVECEVVRRLAGALEKSQVAGLKRLVDAEERATAAGDHREAIRLSGAFHVELARLSGNPLFVLETLQQLQAGDIASGRLPHSASVGALIDRRLRTLGAGALALARLAAIAGPAGLGKTRLAQTLAAKPQLALQGTRVLIERLLREGPHLTAGSAEEIFAVREQAFNSADARAARAAFRARLRRG